MPLIFVFASPRFISCPPHGIFLGEKLAGHGRKKRLNLRFRPEEVFRFRRRLFFFWRSTEFGRKKRLNLRFRPEKAFRFRRRPFFFGDRLILAGKTFGFRHLIFSETSPQSNSGRMKKLCPPDLAKLATPLHGAVPLPEQT